MVVKYLNVQVLLVEFNVLNNIKVSKIVLIFSIEKAEIVANSSIAWTLQIFYVQCTNALNPTTLLVSCY